MATVKGLVCDWSSFSGRQLSAKQENEAGFIVYFEYKHHFLYPMVFFVYLFDALLPGLAQVVGRICPVYVK
jgi:hypothetical protein